MVVEGVDTKVVPTLLLRYIGTILWMCITMLGFRITVFYMAAGDDLHPRCHGQCKGLHDCSVGEMPQ
jgi:hypothetical protein